MTIQTGSSPVKYNPPSPANSKNAGRKTAGSLAVRLVKRKDAARVLDLNLGRECKRRKDSHVFIIFDMTEHGASPVACCCITNSAEIPRGVVFESSSRFACEALVRRYPNKRFLEISAFHMLDEQKARRAKGLLWRAISGYCQQNNIDYVLGCFSFYGKYPAAYALELSYLYHYCQADPELQVAANSGMSMDIMPVEAVKPEKASRFLPPLLRYCLRLGAKASNMVAVDRNTDAMNVLLLIPARIIRASAF